MNSNQITSLVQSLVALACGYFVAHGQIDNSSATQISAGLVALTTVFLAHILHSDPPGGSTPCSNSCGKVSAFIALAALSLFFTGCASAPANAYKAEAATDVTVSTAMTAWGDYVAQNHPSAGEELAVKNAFEKYQAAEILAIDATAFYASETSTNAPADGVNAASQNAASALADLISLIKSFGVNL